MLKQHPQTAYRKYAVLIGTIFENCDNKPGGTVMKWGILATGTIALTRLMYDTRMSWGMKFAGEV